MAPGEGKLKPGVQRIPPSSHIPTPPLFQGCAVGGEEVEDVKATQGFCQPALNIGIPQSTELGK